MHACLTSHTEKECQKTEDRETLRGAVAVTIAHGGRAVMSSPSIRRDKGAKHMSAQVNHASVSDPFELPVPPPRTTPACGTKALKRPPPLSLSLSSPRAGGGGAVAEAARRGRRDRRLGPPAHRPRRPRLSLHRRQRRDRVLRHRGGEAHRARVQDGERNGWPPRASALI